MQTSAKSYHQEIVEEIKKYAGKGTKHTNDGSYAGNTSHYYAVKVPILHLIAKNFAKTHPDISYEDLIEVSTLLHQAPSHEEKTFPGKLLTFYPSLRKQIDPTILASWLNNLEGWCQVDALCQSTFSATELEIQWPQWKQLIEQFSEDTNINKRRASLVLLTGPVGDTTDVKFRDLAFEMIEKLKHEKDILITKAISWLLRSMVKHHKEAVCLVHEQRSRVDRVVYEFQ